MYVWDYRTGQVIDSETGEVVDQIYYSVDGPYYSREEEMLKRHSDVMLPTFKFGYGDRKRYGMLISLMRQILGRELTNREKVRLARWMTTAYKMFINSHDNKWIHAAVYMFMSENNANSKDLVPPRIALRSSAVIRPNRWLLVLNGIVEAINKTRRPHLYRAAVEAAKVLTRNYFREVSGKPAAKVSAKAVYAASVMTEEYPLTKYELKDALGIGYFGQGKAFIVTSSPFNVIAGRDMCEAIMKVARLHPRVMCVDSVTKYRDESSKGRK